MLLLYVVGTALVGAIATTILRAVVSPLRSIPGPFFARFTRLWYVARVVKGHFEAENIALHKRYGPIVRIAPDMFSIDMPEAVGTVYGISSKMPKSEWYDGWQHPTEEKATLFSDREVKRHAETRRRFQALYSMTSLLSYEGYADSCAEIFVQRLDEFAKEDKVFDLAHWFQCYGFDVIGDITYSKRFGFLDRGEDVAGLLKALQRIIVYGALAGIIPGLHPILYRITSWLGLGGGAGRDYLIAFVRDRVSERRAERAAEAATGKPATLLDATSDEQKPQSFLDKMLAQNELDPVKVTDDHIYSMSLANVVAGSDTTAVTLSSIFYHLMRTPTAVARLREEIAEGEKEGKIDHHGHVRFQDAKNMRYLQAVITEALRLHSATGLPLWRDVPESGAVLGGRYFPGGTTVGLNIWCAHYNESVYGPDAREFRPEWWLVEEDKVKKMNAYYLPFGLGSRTCIGRHISMLEIAKLVPLLLKSYDFEAVNGTKEWETKNVWFVKPVDFHVRVKRRFRPSLILPRQNPSIVNLQQQPLASHTPNPPKCPKHINTLLFDCDNTLVLSEELAFEACADLINQITEERGVDLRFTGETLIKEFVGQNFRGMLTSLQERHGIQISPADMEKYVTKEEDAVIAKLRAALRPCPGVDAQLAQLAASHKYLMAVVSSSALRRVQASIEKVGQDKYFPGNVVFSAATSLEKPTSKPDPAVYLHALKVLGRTAAQSVAIEDSKSGTLSGTRAGIKVIGYVGPYDDAHKPEMEKTLTEAGAVVIMRDWSEFPAALEKIASGAV
ncbi:cytochrome P450 pisatin [Cordyceps militaris]|uniref:Cytochrome P450 pisatin n=1 Tax=Cordyceps militaris TaxID=73501 RepID=A0A2H4SDZ4_CORMI|nr:cytochrome P450 pisatin [Cordyceps militaris]